MVLVAFSFAGQNNLNPEKINQNFIKGLTHENPGVVESSIKIVIFMKAAYPEADYSDIIDQLEDLITEGANKNIRLKALIASDYLRNFGQYNWLKDKKYSEDDQVFNDYLNDMRFERMANTK